MGIGRAFSTRTMVVQEAELPELSVTVSVTLKLFDAWAQVNTLGDNWKISEPGQLSVLPLSISEGNSV